MAASGTAVIPMELSRGDLIDMVNNLLAGRREDEAWVLGERERPKDEIDRLRAEAGALEGRNRSLRRRARRLERAAVAALEAFGTRPIGPGEVTERDALEMDAICRLLHATGRRRDG